MNFGVLLFCLHFAAGFLIAADAGEDRVRLFSHVRRSGIAYEWWLSASRAEAIPKWNSEKNEEPPLSLIRALQIARKEGEELEALESISITSIPGASEVPPFNTVFYYKCSFRLGAFDRRISVILMDGTVLKPEIVGKATKE